MTIYLEEEGNGVLPPACENLAAEVIKKSLEYLSCPYEVEVNILLTDNVQIKQINLDFRGIDKATDVLSFPAVEYEIPGDFSQIDSRAECFNPESEELLLGDIVLSKEKVLEQSEVYGHSVKREYAFLLVHSVLHLAGYDHMEEDEQIEMEQIQETILSTMKIGREE